METNGNDMDGLFSRTMRIEHDYEDGTRITGTRREDDLYRGLRSRGWLFRRSASDFRLQGSVDKPAKHYAINSTAEWLREQGFTVEVDIDDTPRAMEDIEASRAERAEERAERLDNRAGRLAREAEATRKKADDVFNGIPFGQPMLVGHHSYNADRNRRERAFNNVGKSVALATQAAQTADRADVAAKHMDHRHSPVTVANRIAKLETELRGLERHIAGRVQWVREDDGRDVLRHWAPTGEALERSQEEKAHAEDQLQYWREVRAQQVADGKATSYSKADTSKGDLVKYRGTWYPVVRASAKSVTVPSMVGGCWTDTIEYAKLSNRLKPADEQYRALADAILASVEGQKTMDGKPHPAVAALAQKTKK